MMSTLLIPSRHELLITALEGPSLMGGVVLIVILCETYRITVFILQQQLLGYLS